MAGALLAALAPWPSWAETLERTDAPVPPALATAAPALREVLLTGFTRARAEAPLVAETSGRVEEVFLDIGDAADEQGRFARLDTTFLELDLAEIGVQQDRLRAQIEYDQREVERYRELARQNNTSASQLDGLEQALRNNNHELRSLEVKQRVLNERLARATIRVPAGWRITARTVEPGQWVREGETVGRAADFSLLLVPFALTSEELGTLTAQADSLRLDLTDLGHGVAARIYRTNPGFDPETRKIAVDLALADPVEPARGGLRARLRLSLPERTGAVSLPAAALEQSYEEYWVTREDGERLRVLLLGPDRSDPARTRVVAPAIHPGDRFRLSPGS